MKKRFFLGMLVCLLAVSFVFVTCDDGSGGTTSIVGTWECELTRKQFAEMSDANEALLAAFGVPEKFKFLKLEFASDGTFTEYEYNPKDDTAEPEEALKGTYVQAGSTVTMSGTNDDGEIKTETATINGSKLNFSTITDDGKSVTLTFNKK